jgi:DNA polymerase I-like protein with 3'-5' exonuclease and polymerase domains
MTVAAPAYEDHEMQSDLFKGLDLHSVTAVIIFPEYGYTYDEFLKELPNNPELQKLRQYAKNINFAMLYGCTAMKIVEMIGCTLSQAEKILERFFEKYQGSFKTREKMSKMFITADTVKWSLHSVSIMHDSITDIMGYTRHWGLEAKMADIFWKMGHSGITLPENLQKKIVIRQERKGEQNYLNAVRSACLGASIAIQQAVARQAGNFLIQSVGANLTKLLMERIWKTTYIPLMNIHDEIQVPEGFENLFPLVKKVVDSFIDEYKSVIPSLEMDYKRTKNWGEK